MTLDCVKCERDYGYVELWVENEFIVEFYSTLNSKIVSECFLHELVFRKYQSEIDAHGGFERVLDLLSILAKAVDDRKPKSQPPTKGINRKHARKMGMS